MQATFFSNIFYNIEVFLSFQLQLNHHHPEDAYNCNGGDGLNNWIGKTIAQVGGAAFFACFNFWFPFARAALCLASICFFAPNLHVDDFPICFVCICWVLANMVVLAGDFTLPSRFVHAVFTGVALVTLQTINWKKCSQWGDLEYNYNQNAHQLL